MRDFSDLRLEERDAYLHVLDAGGERLQAICRGGLA
jgi:hypothetical protein